MIQSPYKLFLTCPRGFETTCSQELKSIGIEHRKLDDGGISFSGNMDDVYKVNYLSSTGMVLWLEICDLNVRNEQSIYETIKKNNWDELFKRESTFSFKCIQKGDRFKNTHFLSLKGKDAIVDYFTDKGLQRPNVEKQDADFNFLILIDNHKGKLLLNTSGRALYKRGYRTIRHDAPLNETVASCILKSIEWKAETPLYDPFCGSGTIPIEAARIAKNVPSGYNRKKWGFEKLPEFNKTNWLSIKETADSKIDESVKLNIYGSDNDNFCTQSSTIHSKQAHVPNLIRFRTTEISDWIPFTDHGMIVTNPPYGIRLHKIQNLKQVFADFGDVLKTKCEGFNAYVIFGNRDFIKKIGLKTSMKKPLRIGALDGRLVGFEMYKGSKKVK
jgi:putative N6-adenine-specific DNA methylase